MSPRSCDQNQGDRKRNTQLHIKPQRSQAQEHLRRLVGVDVHHPRGGDDKILRVLPPAGHDAEVVRAEALGVRRAVQVHEADGAGLGTEQCDDVLGGVQPLHHLCVVRGHPGATRAVGRRPPRDCGVTSDRAGHPCGKQLPHGTPRFGLCPTLAPKRGCSAAHHSRTSSGALKWMGGNRSSRGHQRGCGLAEGAGRRSRPALRPRLRRGGGGWRGPRGGGRLVHGGGVAPLRGRGQRGCCLPSGGGGGARGADAGAAEIHDGLCRDGR